MPGNYKLKDSGYREAKSFGFRSRASLKLIEIDKRHKLFRPGQSVLDLGCAPGGWIEAAAKQIKNRGHIIGIDLEQTAPIGEIKELQVDLLVGDIYSEKTELKLLQLSNKGLDVVLSDMSPKLSGIRFRDACESANLVEAAFYIAEKFLKPGGNFVSKIFPGPESDELFSRLKKYFKSFSRMKLNSTRKTSTEIYFVGCGYAPITNKNSRFENGTPES